MAKHKGNRIIYTPEEKLRHSIEAVSTNAITLASDALRSLPHQPQYPKIPEGNLLITDPDDPNFDWCALQNSYSEICLIARQARTMKNQMERIKEKFNEKNASRGYKIL